jgi:ribosomal protein S18 acetylase RimI-like enzyme
MVLRRAFEADLPEIVEVVNRAYRGRGEAAGWTSEGDFMGGERVNVETLRRDLAESPEAMLLTLRDEVDGPLLGSVWLEPTGDSVWYLGMLNVRPELQDRKIGQQLLAAAEEAARERGAQRIRMTVINVRDTLIDWYLRRGYRLTGETEPFSSELSHRSLQGDLHFVVLEKTV